jgi:hypothetical protein
MSRADGFAVCFTTRKGAWDAFSRARAAWMAAMVVELVLRTLLPRDATLCTANGIEYAIQMSTG